MATARCLGYDPVSGVDDDVGLALPGARTPGPLQTLAGPTRGMVSQGGTIVNQMKSLESADQAEPRHARTTPHVRESRQAAAKRWEWSGGVKRVSHVNVHSGVEGSGESSC